MTKRRDESVLKFSQRFRENIRLFAELPQNAEVIPDVQMRRYFKRGMPMAWQDKLAAAGVTHDTLNEMIIYFSRLEQQERLHKGPSSREGRVYQGGRDKDQVFFGFKQDVFPIAKHPQTLLVSESCNDVSRTQPDACAYMFGLNQSACRTILWQPTIK